MNASYITPIITTVRLSTSTLLAISGGGKGEVGDHGESKRFWGTTILDTDEEKTDFYE